MPTQKPRVTFTISEDELARLEDFQHTNRIKNQTQAILQLLQIGLDDFLEQDSGPDRAKAPILSDGDHELLELYHQLDAKDQGRILGRMEQLLENDKYKNEKRPSAG